MKKPKIDHDGLHKQLLTAFFEQFLEGFFPEVHRELDFSDFGPDNFLSQEQFPEIKGRLHRLDVIAKVKAKGGKEACLIVFIEAQHTKKKEFLARVFRYFALLHIKYNTLVVPIVLYTDPANWHLDDAWKTYTLEFAGHRFLDFRFLAIKTRNLQVRNYIKSHNPAQIALASQMDLGQEDMARIKLELLRQLQRASLTEQEILLAATFVDSYLEEEDESKIRLELELLNDPELKETGMLLNYVRNQGIEQGIEQGQRLACFSNAEKLSQIGLEWDIITQATGIVQAELNAWIEGGRK